MQPTTEEQSLAERFKCLRLLSELQLLVPGGGVSACSPPNQIKPDPRLGFLPEAPPQQKTYKLLNTFPSCSLPNARQEIRLEELASSGQRRGDLGQVPTSSGSGDHQSPCRITRSGTGMKSSDSRLRSWSHVHVREQFVLALVLNPELAASQNQSRSRPRKAPHAASAC